MPDTQNKTHARLISLACLLLFFTFYFFHVLIYWKYTNDDAFITFRYSRYLSMGLGPYYNPGEFVEGYTNFSLMLLVAGFIRLFGAELAPLASKVLGILCAVGSMLLAYRLTHRLLKQHDSTREQSHILASIATGLLCLHPGFAVNSTSGLETMLFGFFLMLAVNQLTQEMETLHWKGSCLFFGLAALTRPEGIYLFTAAWIGSAIFMLLTLERNDREQGFVQAVWSGFGRLWFWQGLAVSLVFFGHIGLRMALYQGEWLPNTYYAKSGGFWRLQASTYIKQAMFPSIVGVFGILVALVGLFLPKQPRTKAPGLLLLVVAAVGMPFITGTDWMIGWRLLAPFLPFVFVLFVVGWSFSLAALFPRWPMLVVGLLFLTIPYSWYKHNSMRSLFIDEVVTRHAGYRTGHRALAKWLCESGKQARSNDAIVVMDIGIIGYYCINQTIIDITGLTDRVIAKSPGTFLRKVIDPMYILKRKPRYVALVLTAKGASYSAPPPGTTFRPWTRMEKALFEHPLFQKLYIRNNWRVSTRRRLTSFYPRDEKWLFRFSRQLGSIRIFEHAHLGRHYLLALFERIPARVVKKKGKHRPSVRPASSRPTSRRAR
jgi:hypothetical protein